MSHLRYFFEQLKVVVTKTPPISVTQRNGQKCCHGYISL